MKRSRLLGPWNPVSGPLHSGPPRVGRPAHGARRCSQGMALGGRGQQAEQPPFSRLTWVQTQHRKGQADEKSGDSGQNSPDFGAKTAGVVAEDGPVVCGRRTGALPGVVS